MPPHYSHPVLYHARTHEWFFLLEGILKITVDGNMRTLTPGGFLYLAPGVRHQVSGGKKPVKVMVLFSPDMNMRRPDICMEKHEKS